MEMIDKIKLCSDITPKLIDDLVAAVWAAQNDGWTDEKGATELQKKIEKVGNYCNIIRTRDKPWPVYEVKK